MIIEEQLKLEETVQKAYEAVTKIGADLVGVGSPHMRLYSRYLYHLVVNLEADLDDLR